MKSIFKNRKNFAVAGSQFDNMPFYASEVSKRSTVEWQSRHGNSCVYAIDDEEEDCDLVSRISSSWLLAMPKP